MIGDNETNFPHKLLLTNRQVVDLRRAFANHLSTDIKLSKIQLPKMINREDFLVDLTGLGINRAGKGKGINRADEGIVRAGYGHKMNF